MQGGFGRVRYSVWTFPQVVPYLEVFRRVIERSVEDAVRRQDDSVKQDKPTLRVQGLPKHVPTTHTLSGGVCLGNI